MPCPHCGSDQIGSRSEYYERIVRRTDANSDETARHAPPTRRASVQGFILAVLAWISLLAPFFAPEGHFWRTSLPIWILTLVWIPIFAAARRKDARLMAEYAKQQVCLTCGESFEG